MIRFACAATALVGLAGCATTATSPVGTEVASDITIPEIPVETLKEVTRTLASDEFEGRAPGTPGEEKTVAYIARQFAQAGLQPGNHGNWVQNVPLVEITGANFQPLTVTAPSGTRLSYDYGDEWVGATYREDQRTNLQDSELVFVGYGINAPERGWNDYAGIDMTGKTAVILVNDPDWDSQSLEGRFGGKAMTYYGRWTYKFEEAARQGAAGALIVHQTEPAAYGWNVVDSSWSGPQVYAQTANGGADQTLVNGWVQKPVAEQILQAAGRDLAALTAQAKQPGFRPIPLGVKVSTSFDNTIRKFQSRNVVGILPGTTRPNEYVLQTAHWDHLGRCKADATGDDICNGAIDNATGVAALVALAEAHVRAGPADRSLLFVAVTAEESGLLGSDYYAANPVYPLAQTVGGLNMDALSLAGPARDVTVIGGGKSELDAYLTRALGAVGRTATPDSNPQAGYYYRSDHFSLAKRGVPMFYIDSGEDLVNGGRAAGAAWGADYTTNRYHQPSDEYDPNWDWSGAQQDLKLFYILGRELAETNDWPNWLEGDEFRRTRDESCAASTVGC